MASPPQNLCNYCHLKSKFGNLDYCGKTCGQQAATVNAAGNPQSQVGATLCKQCNQKPKFQNYDFCGKNCASTWQLAHAGSNGSSNPPGKTATNVQIPSKLLGNIPQPLQAQIQAVLPSLTTVLQQQGQNQPQQQPPLPNVNSNTNNIPPVPPSSVPQQSTVATTLAPNNQNASLPKQKNVNQSGNGGSGLGLPVPQNPQGPTNGTNNNPIPSSVLGQAHGTATPTTCRLTGCTNPVYSDVTYNHVSEYCSKRHRKEAVTTNQVKACIMCLKMPRSSTDHFCSKTCRDAALSQ